MQSDELPGWAPEGRQVQTRGGRVTAAADVADERVRAGAVRAVPARARPRGERPRLTPSALRRAGIPHTRLLAAPPSTYAASILVNLLGVILPVSILQVYDRVIPNQSVETLGVLVLVLVGVAVAEAVLRTLRLYIVGWNAARFAHNIGTEALGRLLAARPDQIWREPPSKTLDRFEAVGKIGNFFGGSARQVLVDLPFAALYLAVIAAIGGTLVLVPVTVIIVFGAITLAYSHRLRETIRQKDGQDVRSFDFVSEVLGGVATIRGQAMEAFMIRRFERLVRTSSGLINRTIRSSDQAQTVAGLLGNATMVAMVSVGAIFAAAGELTVGSLAACSMLAGRTVQPVLRVAGMWNEFQHTRLAVADATTLFALPRPEGLAAAAVQTAPPTIVLDGASYLYPGSEQGWRDVSIGIGAGEIVSFCGPGGVGKSTLLRLIAGLIVPQSGRVTIDGMPADMFRGRVVNSIGYVSPETAPLHGTIMENLTLFGMGGGPEEALTAARQVGIEEEIDRFPDGYETQLGGRAVERIPAGLVQRILIARALAQRPVVLILDEAQSFLDPAGNSALRECLLDLRGRVTVIQVTNQPDYVALSDRVFDLSAGRIRERGSGRAEPMA